MKNNLVLGVSMTLISALAYAMLTAIVKAQNTAIPTPVIVFIQSLMTLLLILPIIFRKGLHSARIHLHSKHVPLHFLRTLFSLGISYFLFFSVSYIPLVNAVLLVNTSPLIVPFLAYFFISKKINHRLWLPTFIGFTGVILVLHPSPSDFNPAALLALCAGICVAVSMLLVRATSKNDDIVTISFYYFLFSTMVSGIIATRFWVPLPTETLMILLGEGALFFIVQIALSAALKYAPAELVSSLYYSNIVFAAIIGMLVWKTELPVITIIGIILTCFGGILCIQVQNRANKCIT